MEKEKRVCCPCGKLLAIAHSGKVYVKCRSCKRVIAVADIAAGKNAGDIYTAEENAAKVPEGQEED